VRREALYALVHGPMDWTTEAAAEHGLGCVIVKMDDDGREVKLALVASGLERV
jgi:hypothetical protein